MATTVKLALDTAEISLLLAELQKRVRVIGAAEAARRIGRPIDDAFFKGLFRVVPTGLVQLRAVPTPAFDELLRLLWK